MAILQTIVALTIALLSPLTAAAGLSCLLNPCAIQLKALPLPLLPSRRADCSSFQRVTVTPAPATVTTTWSTTTVTVTVNQGPADKRDAPLARRQTTATPTSVPRYILPPCRAPSAYASACSCLGVPRITSTAPTPTSTVSVIATTTTTVTAGPVTDICTPGSCNDGYEFWLCPNGPLGCRCGFNPSGDDVCFQDISSCDAACTANEDCAVDQVCVYRSCCRPGPGVCATRALGACNGPVYGSKIKRALGRSVLGIGE
ncbi:hypothetical protein BDW74DRAFT_181566 [Aspergillus multicolor]|uniref:uncharacterized protein n=1 Tax=Aspergillus multicolor TaxID=41759 RepID=UPI003CCDE418